MAVALKLPMSEAVTWYMKWAVGVATWETLYLCEIQEPVVPPVLWVTDGHPKQVNMLGLISKHFLGLLTSLSAFV